MTSKPTKNDTAWERLFSEEHILDHIQKEGFYRISSTRINQVREARLMTKFDHSIQRPAIFQKNNLSIQPTARGDYIIGSFDSYFTLPNGITDTPLYRSLDQSLLSLDTANVYSENAGVMMAYHSGMIDDAFRGEYKFTTFGRMSTGEFSYRIQNHQEDKSTVIEVQNSQCEIDAGFESSDNLILLEVKIGEKKDFIIRQLFYPYRLWSTKISKKIIPGLLTISNDIFSFHIFEFQNNDVYNSLKLKSTRHYCLGEAEINLHDIVHQINNVEVQPENKTAVFPQADEFNRIVDLMGQMNLASEPLDKEQVALRYAFDLRQSDYYLNAGIYLGLIQESKRQFYLSPRGSQIMSAHPKKRKLELVAAILAQPVFNQVARLWIKNGITPSKQEVVKIIRAVRPDVSATTLGWKTSTVERRAQSVLAWIKWILDLSRE